MSAAPAVECAAAALQRTLREAAFTFADPVTDPPKFPGELLEVRLAWSGEGAAELRLATTAAFAATLAANLLGADEPDPARGGDAVGELLNMAAGALVHDAFGPRAACHLGVPRVRVSASEEWEAALSDGAPRASLLEETGHRLDLAIHPAGTAR